MKFANAKKVAFVAAVATLASASAMAGSTDNTFGSNTTGTGAGPVGTLSNWLEGSMGQMFSIGSLAVGLGIGIVKQSVMSVAVGVGIALAASAGPDVLSAIFTATI